jgi:hypothetical protein
MKQAILLILLMLTVTSIGFAQQFTYYYPEIASGSYSEGYWQTTIFLTNTTAPGGPRASGSITFKRDDGSPFNLTMTDSDGNVLSGSTIGFQLAGGETKKFVSVPDTGLTGGFATVTATAPVMGTAMFTQSSSDGQMLGESGVPATIPINKQAILVDTTNGYKTGIAIANPNSTLLPITFQLLNGAAQVVASQTLNLQPFQHFSIFIHEMFPSVGPLVGRLQFSSTNPMTAVGLRFDPSLVLFTTLPPIAVQ